MCIDRPLFPNANQKAQNFGQAKVFDDSCVIYVYGFPPGTEQEDFAAEFFADFPDIEYKKIDFYGDRIYRHSLYKVSFKVLKI